MLSQSLLSPETPNAFEVWSQTLSGPWRPAAAKKLIPANARPSRGDLISFERQMKVISKLANLPFFRGLACFHGDRRDRFNLQTK